jgi:alpha-D-ribose 1-methylphosphonate 5-triphosphate diphosphatase PhnM
MNIDSFKTNISDTPTETQEALVDLWLSEGNTARLILEAFKLGVREGKRQLNEAVKLVPTAARNASYTDAVGTDGCKATVEVKQP